MSLLPVSKKLNGSAQTSGQLVMVCFYILVDHFCLLMLLLFVEIVLVSIWMPLLYLLERKMVGCVITYCVCMVEARLCWSVVVEGVCRTNDVFCLF